jgi:RimJ/RimL family protein N-acetyltransferase
VDVARFAKVAGAFPPGCARPTTSTGRGIATAALRQFVTDVDDRPLYAHAAKHNTGSVRVLEKCGFIAGDDDGLSEEGEIRMQLRALHPSA